MSKPVSKICSTAAGHRDQTPIMSWLRNKLLAVYRNVPAGLPGPDGGSEYKNPLRYPDTQSSRAIEVPKIPGGVHHRLSDTYYYERDGRREVQPPKEVYRSDAKGQKFIGEATEEKQIKLGPEQNFGLNVPTPGFGHEWRRNISLEHATQKNDPTLKSVEKYDRYLRA